MVQLVGKVALMTGAARGPGRALARRRRAWGSPFSTFSPLSNPRPAQALGRAHSRVCRLYRPTPARLWRAAVDGRVL